MIKNNIMKEQIQSEQALLRVLKLWNKEGVYKRNKFYFWIESWPEYDSVMTSLLIDNWYSFHSEESIKHWMELVRKKFSEFNKPSMMGFIDWLYKKKKKRVYCLENAVLKYNCSNLPSLIGSTYNSEIDALFEDWTQLLCQLYFQVQDNIYMHTFRTEHDFFK